MITITMPDAVGRAVFEALNDDAGCRNAVGHAIESARGKGLAKLERTANALGYLSARLADALQHPTLENDSVIRR